MYRKKIIDGYVARIVTYDKNLKYCPYGSCGVLFCDDGTIILVSYTTPVVAIDSDGYLSCYGTYSQTTRKHIGCFVREYAPMLSYYDAKFCYKNNVKMNIHTGELIDA